MNILLIGDVVSELGCNFLKKVLPDFKKIKNIDLVIANGENSAKGNGITPYSANFMLKCGVDVITTGNHAFKRKEIRDEFNRNSVLLRPANFPRLYTPGKGFCTVKIGKCQICVINLLGTVYMESLRCPFEVMDELLKNIDADIIIVDFHAEATAEKRALGFYLDGKVSAVVGTHTHIQTADEAILPKGTAYITDLGMTGAIDSILGVDKNIIIKKFKYKLPIKFKDAYGDCKMDCVIITIDDESYICTDIKRFQITKNLKLL